MYMINGILWILVFFIVFAISLVKMPINIILNMNQYISAGRAANTIYHQSSKLFATHSCRIL